MDIATFVRISWKLTKNMQILKKILQIFAFFKSKAAFLQHIFRSIEFLISLSNYLRWTHHPISFSESVKCQSYQKLKWAAQFVGHRCLRRVSFRLSSCLSFSLGSCAGSRGFLVFLVHPRRDYNLPSGQTVGGLAQGIRSEFSKCKEMSTVRVLHGPSPCPCVLVGVQLKLVACALLCFWVSVLGC